MIVDCHAHMISRAYFEMLETLPGITRTRTASGVNLLRREGTTFLPFRDDWFDADDIVRDMDGKGIDMRIISLSTPSVYDLEPAAQAEWARRINDEMIERAQASPDRLRVSATLGLSQPETALAELERIAGAAEVVGVSVGSNIGGMALNDAALEPVWAALNERRMAVFEHPMHAVFAAQMAEYEMPIRIGFMMDTALALTRMLYSGVFERYPDFPFICAHAGGGVLALLERIDNGYHHYPDCRAHISRPPSEYARQLWYDTCIFYRPALDMTRGIVGAERMLFGTDYPFIDYDAEHVRAMGLPSEAQAGVLGRNAATLLNIAA